MTPGSVMEIKAGSSEHEAVPGSGGGWEGKRGNPASVNARRLQLHQKKGLLPPRIMGESRKMKVQFVEIASEQAAC